MLKNTPRLITFGLILFFSLPIAIEQFVQIIYSQITEITGGQNEEVAKIQHRRDLKDYLHYYTRYLTSLDNIDFDFHLSRATDSAQIHSKVAIIEVGEKSLKDIGQFPFTRTVYKNLLRRLEKAGAKVVAFDMAFPEEDSRREILDELRTLRHEIQQKEGFDSPAANQIRDRISVVDADEDFETAIHETAMPVVLGYTFAQKETAPAKVDADVKDAFDKYDVPRRDLLDTGALFSWSGYLPVLSIAKILGSLNERGSIGHFNPNSDDDGLIRRVPAVIEFNGHVLASLATRAVAAYYGEELELDGRDGLAIRGITHDASKAEHVGKMYLPLSQEGNVILRFYGSGHTFPYTEFSDVVPSKSTTPLTEEQLRDRFFGKIVFVGVTAVGLKDLRGTPLSPDYPGVETHATLASNVLSQSFLEKDYRFFLIGYLFTALFGALVGWAVFRFHPFYAISVAVFGGVVIQLATQYVFFNHGIVVPSILPTLCCFSVFFTGVVYRYFTEEREKKATRAAFSRYVSGAMVEEILKDPSKLRLGGQKKELTVMFVDLVGFTKLTEHMEPSFSTQLLNEYFTRLTAILMHNQGTLDKYMGDSIMCFWGAPVENPEHARLACRTALEMRAELARISREWKLKHGFEIDNRISVHTGEMVVGNVGSEGSLSYTVMGDNVNLGSRLESVNSVYGTSVIVSAATAAKVSGSFLFRPLDRVQVKGKEDAVDILELICEKPATEPEWIYAFRKGLEHYQAGQWDDAESAFGACLTLKPGDGPCHVFIDRIRDFRIVAPDEWRGIWKLSSK